jgi:hypothetical protein
MPPPDHTHAVITRGPITRIFNGRGLRPWLPEVVCAPGWVYRVTRRPTVSRSRGLALRVCWRCVTALLEHHDGHASVAWEDEPPAPDARCPRCERAFGERPD